MDPSLQPLVTIASAVALLAAMVHYNRSLDGKIDDSRQALDVKIDDTRQALDAKIEKNSEKIDATRFSLNDKIESVRREMKIDVAAVAEKADRANEYHIEIRGDLKALTEKVDCIQKQVDSMERRLA